MDSIDLIRSPEAITDAWLTDVLRASGGLSPTQRVAGHQKESFGDAAGLLGTLYRVRPEYDGDVDGPASLVVKFPVDDPGQRGVADALGFYKREVTFYQQFTDGLPFAVPRVYGAVQDTETTDFVLVMEDLGEMRSKTS